LMAEVRKAINRGLPAELQETLAAGGGRSEGPAEARRG
jgi:hypothetical protein